ncbi:MAG: hypothetical protein JNK48_06415 [Bryobacterales bacterium]|nr:hypothetical protein [Bryobacterales bacterium]
MKFITIFLAFLFATAIGTPQQPTYQWHTFYNQGTYGWQGGNGHAVATDAAGNVYAVGSTHNPSTFAPGNPLHSVPAGMRSAFIMKLSPAGALLWYTLYTGPQGASANAVAIDSTGDIYVTGDGALIGDGSQPPINAGGQQSLFILKLNSSGQYRWHTCYGDGDAGMGIAIDKTRHYIYVTGDKHCCTFFNAPVPAIREHVYGINDMFTIAIDSSGAHRWHTFHGPGAGTARAIATLADGSVVAGGRQNGQMVTLKLTMNGALAQYVTWGNGEVRAAAADASGNLYFTGGSWPGWTGSQGQPPVPNCVVCTYSIFLLKTGSDLGYLRHSLYSNNLQQQGDAIALDAAGRLYVTANDPHYGGPGPFPANSLHDNQNLPGHFLASFATADLAYQWHTTYGAVWDDAHGVAVDANRNVYVTGGSGQSWNGDANASPLAPHAGGDSVFVQKFAIAPPTPARLSLTRSLSRTAGQIAVSITIANNGGITAANVVLTTGKINSTSGTPLPQSLGAVAPGASVTTLLTVPGSVGTSGAPATLSLAGTYSGGSFSSAGRVVLP